MPTRVAAAALGLLLLASPAGAQYFGRNKVQYDRFDFRVLETPHFDIYYYAEERAAVDVAARLAERWYDRLSAALDHQFARRQPIVLYASHGHFAQTTVTPMIVGDGIGGFTDHQAGRVILPFAEGFAETDHVLGHELVHAFQRDILRQHATSMSLLPLWYIEGMAEYLSVGRIDSNTAMWLRDAVRQDRLPRLDDLDNPNWFPYRYGQALWLFLSERYGPSLAARTLKTKVKGDAIARLKKETGTAKEELSREWQQWMRRVAAAPPGSAPAGATRVIVAQGKGGGRMNIGPAISPDGTQMVFLSERDGYSIDVYVADVDSGAIVRKLVSTATDAHVDTIQFIESAGAWRADGRAFALASVRDGTARLTVFDMPGGQIVRDIPVADVDQMLSPTWSPDGTRVAFSGLKGGVTDLYVLTLNTGAVRPLTKDLFADLQPAWSPDGTRIAFVTDRFSSSVETLTFGDFDLAIADASTGDVEAVASIAGAKNIDPHWSPDGASLYFVADRGGVSNVYRRDLADGALRQVTSVATGVSGITALSPTLSVAARTGAVVYSAYSDGAYEIDAVDTKRHDAALVAPAIATTAALTSAAGQVAAAGDAPRDRAFNDRPYARRMSLVSIGQPYLAAGGGAFGSFVQAGISFAFGDMLGQHELETAIQVGKDKMDFAVQTAYINRRSRWLWGVVGGEIPSITGLTQTERRNAGTAESTIVSQSVLAEQVHREATGLLMYPFSHARRIEFSAGFDSIAFRTDVWTSTYSGLTGRLTDQSRDIQPGGAVANIVQTGVALVHDTTVHGAASPVLGERYRIGAAPMFGSLNATTIVADYRRYVMPLKPFTLALRAQHVGRYGASAGDARLLPFVWLVQDVVRGFDGRTLPPQHCDAATLAGCDGVDAATTKRLFAANAELRFPIPGALTRTVNYGRIPLEGLVFTDAGLFYARGADLAPARTMLRSAGAGVRLNAGGFVFEFDIAHPIEPALHGWRLSANFRPGF